MSVCEEIMKGSFLPADDPARAGYTKVTLSLLWSLARPRIAQIKSLYRGIGFGIVL